MMTEEEEKENLLPWLFEEGSSCYPLNTMQYTEERTVRRVYALGRVVAKVLREQGVLFWTTGGTSLGIVRHGGLIPWDDDLDICITEQDEQLFTSLAGVFAEHGCGLEKSNSYVWKIFHLTDSEEIEDRVVNYRYPFCDVFVMKWQKNKYLLRDKAGQSAWSNEFYTQEQINSIEYRLFGDFSLPCPGSPEDYLSRTYGESWYTMGATHFLNHKSIDFMQSTAFTIEECMYKPAKPFS